MKKRIANGIQLILIISAFIVLWIPCIEIQHVDLIRYTPIKTHAIGVMDKGTAYVIFALFAINALMCIISIVTKSEHKDGKAHIVMPIIMFFYAATINVEEGNAVGAEWVIVKSNFSTLLFLVLFALIIAISIAKRSSIIAGLPSKNETTVVNEVHETTNADELKKYKELLDNGTITQDEFEAKKKQLLNL